MRQVHSNCHSPLIGQHGQKKLDLLQSHVSGMRQAAQFHKHAPPLHTGLLRAEVIVLVTNSLAGLIELSRDARHRSGSGSHG